MTYRSHLVGGACAGVIGATFLFQESYTVTSSAPIACLFLSSLVGSLMPDIDAEGSAISRANPLLHYFVKGILLVLKGTTWLILHLLFFLKKSTKNKILNMFEHRGIVHSLLMAVLLTILVYFITRMTGYALYISIGFFMGYISHLLMDTLTISGIKWFLPFSSHSFHYPFIRLTTGKTSHEIIASGIFIIVMMGILYINYIV